MAAASGANTSRTMERGADVTHTEFDETRVVDPDDAVDLAARGQWR
jgi:hypothetical protein